MSATKDWAILAIMASDTVVPAGFLARDHVVTDPRGDGSVRSAAHITGFALLAVTVLAAVGSVFAIGEARAGFATSELQAVAPADRCLQRRVAEALLMRWLLARGRHIRLSDELPRPSKLTTGAPQ